MVGCKYFSSCRLDIGRKDICHLHHRVGSNLWKQKMLRSHDVDKWKKCNRCLCLGKVKFLKQPTSPLVITSTFLHSHGFAWNFATTQCVIPESFWEGTFGRAAAVCGRVHPCVPSHPRPNSCLWHRVCINMTCVMLERTHKQSLLHTAETRLQALFW